MDNYKIEYKDFNVYMTPKDGKYTHVILFMHGYGDVASSYIDFFRHAKVLPKNISTKIILLQSPYEKVHCNQPINTSWFTVYDIPMVSRDSYDYPDAQKSAKKVEEIINEEAKLLNGKYENIYVGGFSQGACISLIIGLTFEHTIGGVICLSGYLFPEIEIREENKKINIFVGHGDKDEMIGYSMANQELERIKDFKGLKKYIYPGEGHTVTQQEIIDLNKFLTECMK